MNRSVLKLQEVADYIEGYELKRSTFSGVDREDVMAFVNNICSIYEQKINELETREIPSFDEDLEALKADNTKLLESYEKLKEKNIILESELSERQVESDMVMEILLDARKKSEALAQETELRKEQILEEAKKEARRITDVAEANRFETIKRANKEKEEILLSANEKAQELMAKQNQILSDARKESYNIIQEAQKKADQMSVAADETLLDAEREKMAIIEKANQRAEEIIFESRETNKSYIKQYEAMNERIAAKKREYAEYIADVEDDFANMRQKLIDLKKDLNILFPENGDK